MARFLLDEHLSFRLAEPLRRRGHDAVTARQLGLAGADDATILLEAAHRGCILATENHRDFLNLHYAWRRWPVGWDLAPAPVHAGILSLEQLPQSALEVVATALDEFVTLGRPLANGFYAWRSHRGWSHHPVSER